MRALLIVALVVCVGCAVAVERDGEAVVDTKDASFEQIERTTFGRQMLEQIGNLNSYTHVNQFIQQIGERLADEQRAANETRDKEFVMCNVTVNQLKNTVKHKQALVNALESWVKNLTNKENTLPIAITRHGAAKAQAENDLRQTELSINSTRARRVSENIAFRMKIQNAVHNNRALTAVMPYILGELKAMGHVNNTNATAKPAGAALIETEDETQMKVDVSEELQNEIGMNEFMVSQEFIQSERLDNFLKVMTTLAESTGLTAHVDALNRATSGAEVSAAVISAVEQIRGLMVDLSKEIDEYVAQVNRREMEDMQFYAQELSELVARKKILQKEINFHFNKMAVLKVRLEQVQKQAVEAREEKNVQVPSLNNFKEQLATQKKACRARMQYHNRQNARRAQEKNTVDAIAKLVAGQLKKIQARIRERIEQERRQRIIREMNEKAARAAAIKAAAEAAARAAAGVTTPAPATPATPAANATTGNATNGVVQVFNGTTAAPPKPTTSLPANGALTCADWVKELQFLNQPIKSGVFKLRTAEGQSFDGYCEQNVDNGGWLLAYKQSNFGSGTVMPSASLRGNPSLLNLLFNETMQGSLFDLPHTSLLFRSAVADNWFVTPAIAKYGEWNITDTPRFCLFRPLVNTEFRVSPTWNFDALHMWNNASISLMKVAYPTISAVVIGNAVARQSESSPAQCLNPQCSPFRHGRYNGQCQNGSSGEGNWQIFVR